MIVLRTINYSVLTTHLIAILIVHCYYISQTLLLIFLWLFKGSIYDTYIYIYTNTHTCTCIHIYIQIHQYPNMEGVSLTLFLLMCSRVSISSQISRYLTKTNGIFFRWAVNYWFSDSYIIHISFERFLIQKYYINVYITIYFCICLYTLIY